MQKCNSTFLVLIHNEMETAKKYRERINRVIRMAISFAFECYSSVRFLYDYPIIRNTQRTRTSGPEVYVDPAENKNVLKSILPVTMTGNI